MTKNKSLLMTMEVPDIQDLDKLCQAISEALEIEKCSICLEKLESTVLLWPCTHWFCNNCILSLHKSARGEKVTCPLCKCLTTRRKILHFQEKQIEYEDYLQTLIGALSLDLKFDVTSYKNVGKEEIRFDNKVVESSTKVDTLSPVKRTRTKPGVRVIEVKNKPDVQQNTKGARRSGKYRSSNTNPTTNKNNKEEHFKSPNPIQARLPDTPDTPKQKKVKEWLDSNRFSQVDEDISVETVVADVHNAEHNESLNFSETALLPVSQVDHGSLQTPIKPIPTKKTINTLSDVHVIQVCNKTSSSRGKLGKKQVSMPSVEKFDALFPENRKIQAITTTYGSKNPYTSTRTKGQKFAVQVDIFESIDENKGDTEKSSLEPSDKSEETLEDFSSGSGEEWTIEKKPKKANLLSKGTALKNDAKNLARGRVKNSIEKFVSTKLSLRSNLKYSTKNDSKAQINEKSTLASPLNPKEDNILIKVKSSSVEEFVKPKDDIVKEIIDDWNDTKDSNNLLLVKTQASNKHPGDKPKSSQRKSENISELNTSNSQADIENKLVKTPCKEVRSPGWSRLKSTKKEFHLSETKKLDLKTLNKSKSNSSLSNIGISPLQNQSKNSVGSDVTLNRSNVQSDNISVNRMISLSSNEISNKNVDITCDKNIKKTPEVIKHLDISFNSNASGSPFRGFPTPDEKDSTKKCSLNIGLVSETPKNSVKAHCSSQKKTEVSNKVLNEDSTIHESDNLSKEDPMEVDVSPFKDLIASSQCKNNNGSCVNVTKMDKKINKSIQNLESNSASVKTIFQEDQIKSSYFTKKRDRDSGIHNESGIASPVRKKICRDAEVQTSPGRMKSVIRDMLKDMCGIELDEIVKQSSTKAESPQKPNIVDATNSNNSYTVMSQDSDKENVDVVSKNQNISKKYFDESDIVYGTEDNVAFELMNYHVSTGRKFINDVDDDPNAPTQPYKTPVVPKKPLQTSTKDYTVVSNPSLSELKRTDYLFDKSDIIFPDETPKGATPWDYSGVNQLEGNTDTVKKIPDENTTLNSFQSLKEKSNRSRRQLDFVEDCSDNVFEFERQISDKLKEETVNNKTNNCRESNEEGTLPDRIEELDDIFMEDDELVGSVLDHPEKDVMNLESHKNTGLIQQEVSVEENGNLTDTPGMVGPSEEQSLDCRVDLRPKVKTNVDKSIIANLHFQKNDIDFSESMKQNNNLQQVMNVTDKENMEDYTSDSLMLKKSAFDQPATCTISVNAGVEDEVSNPESDVSYVEGTPEVSQIENDKEMGSNTNDIKEACGNSFMVVGPSRERDRSDKAYFCEPVNTNVRSNTDHKLQQKAQLPDQEALSNNQLPENTEDENLCFASSLLNPQQNQVLACVLGGMGITCSKTVGPHISHLIVGTKNGCFQNTYKVLLAMALHKPIIRFDWVEEVIRIGGTVPLDPFVALDPSGECGVVRAKADKNRKLLQDFAIHIYNVNDRIVLKEQIEELVRLCGATVVKELKDFCEVPRDKFRIIVLSEPPDSLTQGDWRHKYHAVEVMIDWVYNTIGRYRVMPLVPFMVTEASDAVPFLQHEGYPKELIFDLSTQE